MPSPFPGMDPWLERPTLWPGFHENLIISLQRALAPLVRPRYYIDVKQRLVFAAETAKPALIYPDAFVAEQDALAAHVKTEQAVLTEPINVEVPVREKVPEDYLEVVEVSTHQVITVIEILSPSNKTPGKDRRAYEYKRERIFQTSVHLVEIDLLRDGEPMPFTLLQTNGHWNHYRVLVKRGDRWRRAHLYPFSVRDAIPVFPLPLQPGDAEPPIKLGEALKEVYDSCGYDLRIDYSRSSEPPLSEDDMLWSKEILCASNVNVEF